MKQQIAATDMDDDGPIINLFVVAVVGMEPLECTFGVLLNDVQKPRIEVCQHEMGSVRSIEFAATFSREILPNIVVFGCDPRFVEIPCNVHVRESCLIFHLEEPRPFHSWMVHSVKDCEFVVIGTGSVHSLSDRVEMVVHHKMPITPKCNGSGGPVNTQCIADPVRFIRITAENGIFIVYDSGEYRRKHSLCPYRGGAICCKQR